MKNLKNLNNNKITTTNELTKEQLVVELAKAKQSRDYWMATDERQRREFAKAFNWVKNASYNQFTDHIEKEPQLPSWEQIFVQIGRLLVLEELKQEFKHNVVFPLPDKL